MVLREADATPDRPLMHAAHRDPFAESRDDSMENLDAACEPCHRAEHYGPEED